MTQYTQREAGGLGGLEVDDWVKFLCSFVFLIYLKKRKLTFGSAQLLVQVPINYFLLETEVTLTLGKVTEAGSRMLCCRPGDARDGACDTQGACAQSQ